MTTHILRLPLQQARGVIGRYPDEDERYVFEFDTVARRPVHMVGVRRPLAVTWLIDGGIVHEETLRPWVGYAAADADTVIEERPSEERE